MIGLPQRLSRDKDAPAFAEIASIAEGNAGGAACSSEDTFNDTFGSELPAGASTSLDLHGTSSENMGAATQMPHSSRRSSVSSRLSSSLSPSAASRLKPNMAVVRAKLKASHLLARACKDSSSGNKELEAECGTSSCSIPGGGRKEHRRDSILTKGGAVKYGASGEGVARCERRIFIAFRIIQIGEIDIRDQAFICRFDLFVEWVDEESCRLTPADLGKEDADHFEPTIRFTNADDFVLKDKLWIVFPETKFVGYRVTVQGRFRMQFDFQNFPFDVQRLIIELTMGQEKSSSRLLHNELCQFRHSSSQANTLMQQFSTEYTFRPLRYRITTTSSIEGMGGKQTSQYQLIAPIRRQYSYYLSQVYVIAVLIQALAFGIFALPYDDNTRMEVLAALVLVLSAFKLQVSNDLPKVPQMTQLDRYLLAVHFFFGGIYVHVCLGLTWAEDMTQEADRSVLQIALFIWALMHLYFLFSLRVALLDQKGRLSRFGELDANLQLVLRKAGYELVDNVMQGDLHFDEDGVDITEWTLAERGLHGNTSSWASVSNKMKIAS